MNVLTVVDLVVYPLKSAQGVHLESMQLNDLGPSVDRRWMVIDSKGSFVTQRKTPEMCFIETRLASDDQLALSGNGIEECIVPAGGYDLKQSSVWGTEVQGEDCGDAAAKWISTFLNKDCRIIYMPKSYARSVDTNYAKQGECVGFADGFPLLIATRPSLNDFNTKLGFEISMDRFRPNIVVDGNQAWDEDNWEAIEINGIRFDLVKPCSRCIMPSINPKTAEKQMAVNQALLKYRRRGRNTYFGQNAIYDRTGTIKLGDTAAVRD